MPASPMPTSKQHQVLFQMASASRARAPWSSVKKFGWESATAHDPPLVVFDSEKRPWGLLGTIAGTLASGSQGDRRIDLLERALRPDVPASLWRHESLSGCSDLLLATMQARAFTVRQTAKNRLVDAQKAVYTTRETWIDAFVSGMAAWHAASAADLRNQVPIYRDTGLLTALVPTVANTGDVFPYPDWFGAVEGVRAERLAPLVGEAMLKLEHPLPASGDAQKVLLRRWERWESEGDVQALSAWTPCLLAMALADARNADRHTGNAFPQHDADPWGRLRRWSALGVDLSPGMAVLRRWANAGAAREKDLAEPILSWLDNLVLSEKTPPATGLTTRLRL